MITIKSFRCLAQPLGRRNVQLRPQCASFNLYSTANNRNEIIKPQVSSRLPLTSSILPWKGRFHSLRLPAIAAISMRLNSTASNTSSAVGVAGSNATSEPIISTTFNDGFDIAEDGIAKITERIGYLKEMGLDYGWGPTAFMEWLLEHIYIYSGTSWWASILLTAVAVRLMLIKPYMEAADVSARLATLQPILKPITDKMTQAGKDKDRLLMQQCQQEMQRIRRKVGIKVWKMAIPLTQVFLGYGTFRLMRGMSLLPVPGLETGGLLWIHDLTISDPLYVLPLATTFMFFSVMKLGGESGQTLANPAIRFFLTYILPTFSGMLMLWWPAALQLSFFFSSMLSVAQAALLRNNTFRDWAGVTRLPSPTTSGTSPSPVSGKVMVADAHQAPATPVPTSPVRKTKGFIHGAISEFKGARSEAMKSATKYMEKEEVDEKVERRRAAEAKEAELYEEKKASKEAKTRAREMEQESKLAAWQKRNQPRSQRRGR